MIGLLQNDVVDAINAQRSGKLEYAFPNQAVVPFEDINDTTFDIIDVKGIGGSAKRPTGNGDATYINRSGINMSGLTLRFIRYEEYLNQFRIAEGDWAQGMSRPDFIVYTPEESGDHSYFIVHELSTGHIGSKRHKAVTQILNTLRFFFTIPSVKEYIAGFANRVGYISAKGCIELQTPLDMGAAFMMPYQILPDPVPVANQSIARMGFQLFETNVINLT
ncbi:MAG: hypothetical protein HDS04_07070 [Bacteroides sp.]|nr:hypothetical protein [Bacteroides sp.]MBD5327279.1 hypothetical protein [Bacteroides sp.]